MMESQRGFLLLLLAAISFLLYQAWQKDYATPEVVPATQTASPAAIDGEFPNVESDVSASGAVPDESLQGLGSVDAPIESNPSNSLPAGQLITVTTDTLKVNIDTRGGDIVYAELSKYPKEQGEPAPVVLFNNRNGFVYEGQSGLLGQKNKPTPDSAAGRQIYQVSKTDWTLEEGAETLKVVMSWASQGIEYEKHFTFYRDQYIVDVDYLIKNNSDSSVTNQMFMQLKRDRLPADTANDVGFGIQAYLGSAYSSTETRYERYDAEDMEDAPLNVATEGGWIAYLQHYFVTAWIPKGQGNNQISSQLLSNNRLTSIRMQQPALTTAPGATSTTGGRLYMGPKDQDRLEEIAEGLSLTVDYGFLWWIGKPLFWLLQFFHSFIPNWGVAIILVTFMVKLLFYPLSNKQYRSFAKMRDLAPKLQRLKERHGEDRQKMSAATMELYKKEKVNPLSGCLPMLVQMPVFIALYWVLLESVELRHATFIPGWINDLSIPDPFFILPLLMGGSMWMMQKLQPTSPTMDPMQQKIMQFLPVMMTAFFLFFPAGLVLYWVTNNLLTLAQQTYVNKKIQKEKLAKS